MLSHLLLPPDNDGTKSDKKKRLPVGLEDVYDAQVDEQFVVSVCPGRDPAHPER